MTLLTAKDCLNIFGDPHKESSMMRWNIPVSLQLPDVERFPEAIYCNKHIVSKLTAVLYEIKEKKLDHLLQTYDGCFNIRSSKGNSSHYSLHAWGLAVDFNAGSNKYGHIPTMDDRIVRIFKENGFDWGGEWSIPDGMHFQVKKEVILAGK